MAHSIAILTGDIVASEQLGPDRTEAVLTALGDQARAMANWLGHDLVFSRSRGDGWQVVLGKPELALRCALAFAATARSLGKDVATRVSIGTGPGELPQTNDLNTQTGRAYVASGWGLDQIPAEVRIAKAGSAKDAALARLADHVAKSWTPAQAAAMRHALAPSPWDLTQTEIASILGKSRQSVAQALEGAGATAILWALERIETDRPEDTPR